MLTQVTFTTQDELKKQALTKAKHEGLSLKAVLVYALKGFVSGTITFGLNAPVVESDVEVVEFIDYKLNDRAIKLARLLK